MNRLTREAVESWGAYFPNEFMIEDVLRLVSERDALIGALEQQAAWLRAGVAVKLGGADLALQAAEDAIAEARGL